MVRLAALLAALAFPAGTAGFDWSMPPELHGGVRTAAEAGRPPATAIDLRTCASPATWELDGAAVTPARTGTCTYRLDLHDTAVHRLALGGGTPQPVQARHLLVVSIGDSVASGEGDPGPGGAWISRPCHRSLRSGAALAAIALENQTEHSAVTFLPLACSGATIDTGLLGPYRGIEPQLGAPPLPPQVDALKALRGVRPVDAVLVSVGANDVDFGPVAHFCVVVRDCEDQRFDPAHPNGVGGTRTAPQVIADALAALPGRYDALAAALDAAGVPPGRVIIVEYFDPTQDENGTCTSALRLNRSLQISADELQWAHDAVLVPLNAAVHAAAAKHGWQVVSGVQAAFRGHGICVPQPARWIRTPTESFLRGSGLSGPLHPNEAGHFATANLIEPVLARVVGEAPATLIVPAERDPGTPAWIWIAALAAALAVGFAAGRRTRR